MVNNYQRQRIKLEKKYALKTLNDVERILKELREEVHDGRLSLEIINAHLEEIRRIKDLKDDQERAKNQKSNSVKVGKD